MNRSGVFTQQSEREIIRCEWQLFCRTPSGKGRRLAETAGGQRGGDERDGGMERLEREIKGVAEEKMGTDTAL